MPQNVRSATPGLLVGLALVFLPVHATEDAGFDDAFGYTASVCGVIVLRAERIGACFRKPQTVA